MELAKFGFDGKGQCELRKKPLFWRMSAPWPAPKDRLDHWVAYAVVHNQWKLAVNNDHSHAELFDLVQDPLERKKYFAGIPQNSGSFKEYVREMAYISSRKTNG